MDLRGGGQRRADRVADRCVRLPRRPGPARTRRRGCSWTASVACSCSRSPSFTRSSAVYSVGYLRPRGRPRSRLRQRLWPLLNLFGLALLAMPIVANLGVMWVAVELTTSSAHCWSPARARTSVRGVVEVHGDRLQRPGVALLGIIVIYAAGVHEPSSALHAAFTILACAAPHLVRSRSGWRSRSVLVGFGTKVGFVPMHTWLPDAHQ